MATVNENLLSEPCSMVRVLMKARVTSGPPNWKNQPINERAAASFFIPSTALLHRAPKFRVVWSSYREDRKCLEVRHNKTIGSDVRVSKSM